MEKKFKRNNDTGYPDEVDEEPAGPKCTEQVTLKF